MYLPFFQLNEKPFSYLTPNPWFFYYAPQYLSVKHKTANALLRRICAGFGVKTERSYNATLENLTTWLVQQYKVERFPVLIVDEAQNIVRDGLKTLHYLMTYVTSDDLLLMIILCGQEELATHIERFPEIKSRMYPSALSSLSREETEELVRYRWQVASIEQNNPMPFEKSALDAIFEYSKGLPREICKIWDLALLASCAEQRTQVEANTIRTVAASLALKGEAHGRR